MRCRKRLEQFLIDLLEPVGRSERRHWGEVYVRSLLLDGERKSIEPLATRLPEGNVQAMQQFFAHGLHRTESRTGVLIFAAVAERYAEIVADAGIDSKVTPQVWAAAIDALIEGIKQGRPADGFVAAIERCGRVLAEHFPPGALKRDELPNRLVEI